MPELAINGAESILQPGDIPAWPPTSDLDRDYVLASLNSDKHAWGSNCEALQNEWAEWNGNKHCLTCSSGTSGLQLALAGCGLSAGDEVITPAYSWTSSVSCILHQGLIPVFADLDFATCNIDPAKIEEEISERTGAILVVHLHGLPCDMDAILEVAKRHGLKVIEDGCQAHGATYQGRKVGTLGDAAAFSMNQNKMLASGEGGLFVTDDEGTLKRARAPMLFGDFREPPADDPDYHSYGLGYMCRNNELCAAYGRAQLTRLDEYIADARSLTDALTAGLEGTPGLILPHEPEGCRSNCYNYVVRVDAEALGYDGPVEVLREAVVQAFHAEHAPTGIWQRRILPELGAIRARNAYGRGYPWAIEGTREIDYHPSQFPAALRHVDSYIVIGGLRTPNTTEVVGKMAAAVRRVLENIGELDIEGVAEKADKSFYERGWRQMVH